MFRSDNFLNRIFSMCTSLAELDFGSAGSRCSHARLKIVDLPSTTCYSSCISHLRVRFDDRLCLFDDHLTQSRF